MAAKVKPGKGGPKGPRKRINPHKPAARRRPPRYHQAPGPVRLAQISRPTVAYLVFCQECLRTVDLQWSRGDAHTSAGTHAASHQHVCSVVMVVPGFFRHARLTSMYAQRYGKVVDCSQP